MREGCLAEQPRHAGIPAPAGGRQEPEAPRPSALTSGLKMNDHPINFEKMAKEDFLMGE